MKTRNTILLAIVTFCLANTVSAAPVKYIFIGNQVDEELSNYSTVPTASNIFANGTSVSVSFFYDSSNPATSTNVPAASLGGYISFGDMSVYNGASTQLSGVVSGHQFSATAARTLVSNANPGDVNSSRDGVFISSGLPDVSFPAIAGSGFQGFKIGGFTLTGLNLFKVGGATYLSSQSLPNSLLNNATTDGLYLTFVDSNNTERLAEFVGNFTPAPVPIPAAAWLFGSGLVCLAGTGRKHKSA